MSKEVIDTIQLKTAIQNLSTYTERTRFISKHLVELFQFESDEKKKYHTHRVLVLAESSIDNEILCEDLLETFEKIFKITVSPGVQVFKADGTFGLNPSNQEHMDELANKIESILQEHERAILIRITEGGINVALNSEEVASTKEKLLGLIHEQMETLLPVALKDCKDFRPIAFQLVDGNLSEKEKLDGSKSVHDPEEQLKKTIRSIETGVEGNRLNLLKQLSQAFRTVKVAYLEKRDAFQCDKKRSTTEQETLLTSQINKIDSIQTSLTILENAIENLPYLESHLKFLAQSTYQAKSVELFFQEIQKEVEAIFQKGNIDGFKVIAALNYKLKARSMQYWAVENYAVIGKMKEVLKDQWTAVMVRNLIKKNKGLDENKVYQNPKIIGQVYEKVEEKLSGLTVALKKTHREILEIISCGLKTHHLLIDFQKKVLSYQQKNTPKATRIRDGLALEKGLKGIYEKVIGHFNLVTDDEKGLYCQGRDVFSKTIRETLTTPLLYDQMLFCDQELEGTEDSMNINMSPAELALFRDPQMAQNLQKLPAIQSVFNDELVAFLGGETSVINDHENGEALKKLLAKNITPSLVMSFIDFIRCIPKKQMPLLSPAGKNLLEVCFGYKEILERTFAGFIATSQRDVMQKGPFVKAFKLLRAYLTPHFQTLEQEREQALIYRKKLSERDRVRWQEEVSELISFWKGEINRLMFLSERERESRNYKKISEKEVGLMSKHISSKQLFEIEEFLEIPPGDDIKIEGEEVLLQIAYDFLQRIVKDPSTIPRGMSQKQHHALLDKEGKFNVLARIKQLNPVEAEGES